jgi:hypothetical protein
MRSRIRADVRPSIQHFQHMTIPDFMLLLGLSAVVAIPVIDSENWTREGYEDEDGFHFGRLPEPVRIPVSRDEF